MANWPQGWQASINPAQARVLETEFKKELSASHELAGKSVSFLARRYDSDDVLFALESGAVAQVHLTWRSSPELEPIFPRTLIFDSLEDWVSNCVRQI